MIKHQSWGLLCLVGLLFAGLYVASTRAQTRPAPSDSGWAQWQGKRLGIKMEDGGMYFGQFLTPIILDGDTYLNIQSPDQSRTLLNTRKIIFVQGIP